MTEEFADWLKKDTCAPFYCETGRRQRCFALIKVRRNQKIDLLFGQKNKLEEDLLTTDFGFAGIYLRQADEFYYTSRDFKKALPSLGLSRSEIEQHSIHAFSARISQAINSQIEQIIDDNPDHLELKALHSEKYLYELAKMDTQNMAYHQAKYFFDQGMKVKYLAEYPTIKWPMEEINAYLLDPEEYIDRHAREYIQENQEYILYKLLRNSRINEEYTILQQTRDKELPIASRIYEQVKDFPGRTVQVLLQEGSQLIHFDMETSAFQPQRYEYPPSAIPAPDHTRYISQYGPRPVMASAIESIKTGGKTLYQRPYAEVDIPPLPETSDDEKAAE